MTTRARIALALPSGKFKSIYVHKDGYPGGVGQVLVQHYNNAASVRALLALGDLSVLASVLAPAVGQAHDFNNPAPDVTLAYGRDRGDTGAGVATSFNLVALAAVAAECNAEYMYVFQDGSWLFAPVSSVTSDAFSLRSNLAAIPTPAPQDIKAEGTHHG